MMTGSEDESAKEEAEPPLPASLVKKRKGKKQ